MTKAEFYRGRTVAIKQWWLHDCDLPDRLQWARLRVFDDGRADACFDPTERLYGFDCERYAGYFLSEDEYIRFDHIEDEDIRLRSINAEDELKYYSLLRSAQPPNWETSSDQSFEYLGTY